MIEPYIAKAYIIPLKSLDIPITCYQDTQKIKQVFLFLDLFTKLSQYTKVVSLYCSLEPEMCGLLSKVKGVALGKNGVLSIWL